MMRDLDWSDYERDGQMAEEEERAKQPCPWCEDDQSEAEEGLCQMHEAERLGITQDQLTRMEEFG